MLKPLSIIVLIAISFTSCKKENTGDEPFSMKTVEENKQLVEDAAISLAKSMDKMKDLESADAAVSLGNLLDMSDPMANKAKKSSKVSATIAVIAGVSKGDNSLHDILTVMKSAGELEEDPETIQEIWDELAGTYTWDPLMEEWNYQAGSDKVIFMFPSTDGGSSNDASLTISNYAGVTISTPIDEEYTGDFPTALNMDLVVGTKSLISYVFSAQYNDEGVPSMVASDLTLESFKFTVDMTNNSTEVSANYKITDDGVTMIEVSGSIKGDFSNENIDANTVTYTDTWTYTDYVWNDITQQYEEVLVTETSEWQEVEAQEIFHSANAKFQVVDIALKGEVNIKDLVNEIDALYPDDYYNNPNFDEKAAAEKEAEAMNNHVNLSAVNETTGEKIAEAEAYMVQENFDGYLDYWVDIRLKFGDGSLIDLETYFEEGFEDFIDEINAMIAELNGEYDWGLEQLEY